MTMAGEVKRSEKFIAPRTRELNSGRAEAAIALGFLCAALLLGVGAINSGCTYSRWKNVVPPGYSFSYTLQDREATGLIQVFDDGQKTYLQFSDWSRGSPSIFDGNGTSLSYVRSGTYAVIAGRHERLLVNAEGAQSIAVVDSAENHSPGSVAVKASTTATIDDLHGSAQEVDSLRTHVASLEEQLAEARAALQSYADRLVIHFANNSARVNVDPDTMRTISDVVREKDAILVAGYTDATYSDAAGEALARRRAQNVRKALVAEGIPAEHVAVTYHAAGSFAADNHSAEGRALNRRAEIVSDPEALQASR
jgi:outer membrane protein OmpA-like peptidoglycan-associated protein